MAKSKQDLIKIYIDRLEKELNKFVEVNYQTHIDRNDGLSEQIIEIMNIFSKEIPKLKEIVLLNKDSIYRDAKSILGKMKLNLLLEKDNKAELIEFIESNIKTIKFQLFDLENCLPEGNDILEDSLFETIIIVINTFSGYIPEIEKTVLLRNETSIRDAKAVIGKLRLEKASIYEEDSGTLVEAFLSYASEVLGDTQKGMTGTEIVKHSNRFAVKYGVDIPITSSDFGQFGTKVQNKRTALYLNLCKFNAKQQFEIISELCKLDKFNGNKEVSELKNKLYDKFNNYSPEKLSESELIVKTEHWLSNYPGALKQYDLAIEKYEKKVYERNTLDDMRLAFELLLKDILNNPKSLENQIPELGKALNNNNISKEIRNLIMKVIDYYSKYHNDKVKHDDKLNSIEIEYIIEQTSILMKFIIKVLDY